MTSVQVVVDGDLDAAQTPAGGSRRPLAGDRGDRHDDRTRHRPPPGGALRLTLKLHEVVADWNPPNGFDHVAFSVFFARQGDAGGVAAMPQQNADLADGLRWHLRLRAHGWSNTLFSATGASATADGTVVSAAPRIDVDHDADTVTFTLPANALGDLRHPSATHIYVSTWDYDGGYRPLAPQASGNTFGGGEAREAKVMDDLVIRLPTR